MARSPYNYTDNLADEAKAVTTDSSGNVYAVGFETLRVLRQSPRDRDPEA